MGTIVMGTIVDRARTELLENSSADVRYNRTGELLNLGNAAMREIVAAKPDAYVRNEPFLLGPGSKQELPEGGVQFFGVEHNLGADGLTPVGPGILIADRSFLTRANRNWITATGPFVEHFLHDQRVPKVFYVYPRPTGAWYVNLAYSAVPPAIAAADIDDDEDGKIPIDDLWDSAIADYIVGYGLLKNSSGGNFQKATYFLQKFYNCIGKKLEAQMMMAPLDAEAAEMTPDAPGKP